MAAGLAAALAGDWLLAVRGASRASPEFLAGVLCFSLAQILWSAGQLRVARPRAEVFAAAALPLALFAGVRLRGALPPAAWGAVCAYSLLTAFSFAVAVAARRRFYGAGVALLLVSDLMIGGRLLGVPGCSSAAGPLYAAAEACLLASFFLGSREPRRRARTEPAARTGAALDAALLFGGAALGAFLLAALSWPGDGYDPFRRMLSALGRTEVRGVEWPLCHYLFMAGMFLAAFAVVAVFLQDVRRFAGRRRAAVAWGLAANAGGLAAIALVPENVHPLLHDAGCWAATLGGGAILLARDRTGRDRVWTRLLAAVAVALGAAVALHAVRALPFSPWTPTAQKIVIAAFALWTLDCAARSARADGVPLRRAVRRRTWIVLALLAALIIVRAALFSGGGLRSAPPAADAAARAASVPFTDDESAALRWLEHVTGPLPPEEEREWWNIGGTQHGLFAKRYHIAFCGYAAAALGTRGGTVEYETAGRILGHCVERFLRRDAWAYSQSKSYWGRKPWAPDPCFRENVMYTGHLLQLLALYETFTGDTRYWTDGWDFVWTDGRRVHYTVQRLVDVTVEQMRNGPNGGVCCEPGLMFFPCNNHPHVALALFARLGHGDWTADARRWERWALAHYRRPLFGGGALSLVWHARSNLVLPRGQNGLDGWSLLWYEPWAEDRGAALALWREAAARIDWTVLETGEDAPAGAPSCRDPAPVPPVAASTFLAAAARACDDPETARRLERLSDRALVRRDGMLYLDVGREWRIGATANRILSLAEENGFRFKDLLRPAAALRGGVRTSPAPRHGGRAKRRAGTRAEDLFQNQRCKGRFHETSAGCRLSCRRRACAEVAGRFRSDGQSLSAEIGQTITPSSGRR